MHAFSQVDNLGFISEYHQSNYVASFAKSRTIDNFIFVCRSPDCMLQVFFVPSTRDVTSRDVIRSRMVAKCSFRFVK